MNPPQNCPIHWWLLASLVLAFTLPATAQPTNSAWSAHVWQSDDGLPNNNVTSLAQTPDGYLWAANPSLLVRFDGTQFEAYAPKTFGASPNQKVHVILRSREGGLWLAMEHGVIAYLKDGHSQIYTKNLPDLSAQALTEGDDGSLWVVFNRGIVYRVKDGEGTLYDEETGLPAGTACSLMKDSQGKLWFAKGDPEDCQVGIFQDGRFQTLLRFGPPIIRLGLARTGGVWICSGSLLFKYSEGGKLEKIGRYLPEHANRKPRVVYEDNHGAVWIGTSDSGLFRYDGKNFESIPTSHPAISDVMEDREGNLWVATLGGGLDRIRPRAVALEGMADGLPFQTVTSLCEDSEGALWATTQNNYLVRHINGKWVDPPTNVPGEDVTCLTADRAGTVWIGTKKNELYCYKNGLRDVWRAQDGLASQEIRSMLATSAGDLWIGGEMPNSLQCLHDGRLNSYKVPPGARTIRAMAEDSMGFIWIGTSGGTLLWINDDAISDETAKIAGDPSKAIRCLYTTPDDSLWIGYAVVGLGRLKDGKFTKITGEQGLYDNSISQIVADEHGWLWLGSDHGIFKVQESELEAVADGRAARIRSTHYGRDEGLASLQANFDATPGAIRSSDGRLWMPMRTALAVINPENLREDQSPPPVLLTRMDVDDRTVAAYGGVMPLPGVTNLAVTSTVLRLPPDHRRIEFGFTAFNFSAPDNVHFRYRLQGFDDDWVEGDTLRGASYPRLPAGEYEFRVAACNSDGAWNEARPAFVFSVSPFFWQTWSFRAGAFIVFTAAMIMIIRYALFRRLHLKLRRLEQQAALDKERARIARDLHDDLGGSLTEVSLLLGLTGRELGAPQKTEGNIQQCSSLIQQMSRSVDEIIWAINPRNDTLRYLIDYISQFVVEFLHAANIRCRVTLPDQIPERTLSPEARHNLFLVVKEVLNNIARHSHATEVRLGIAATEDEISLTIEDNGRGFDSAPDNGQADGLRNMRQRMEEIGGHFQIESMPQAGTRVLFLYRFPQPFIAVSSP